MLTCSFKVVRVGRHASDANARIGGQKVFRDGRGGNVFLNEKRGIIKKSGKCWRKFDFF